VTAAGERGDEPAVTLKTWIAVGGGLLGAFLAVLNIQITNASLPYIEGGIGTGGVYGTWISTAYLIGEIIVIPLTDFLSRVFSLRRYLLANTALFLVFSVLCGHAQSLSQMIVFRALQGFSGGVLIPLAFTIVMRMLPQSKQAIGLVLLCHKFARAPRGAAAPQQGQRGKRSTMAAMSRRRMVAIEFGMWRSGRKGGCAGSATVGNGKLRASPGAMMS